MLGGILESDLRNFFRSNLPPWGPVKWCADPTLSLGGNGGWRMDAVAMVFGGFGKVCEIFSVNSPPATQHMVLQSMAGFCQAGWMLSLWSSAA